MPLICSTRYTHEHNQEVKEYLLEHMAEFKDKASPGLIRIRVVDMHAKLASLNFVQLCVCVLDVHL